MGFQPMSRAAELALTLPESKGSPELLTLPHSGHLHGVARRSYPQRPHRPSLSRAALRRARRPAIRIAGNATHAAATTHHETSNPRPQPLGRRHAASAWANHFG